MRANRSWPRRCSYCRSSCCRVTIIQEIFWIAYNHWPTKVWIVVVRERTLADCGPKFVWWKIRTPVCKLRIRFTFFPDYRFHLGNTCGFNSVKQKTESRKTFELMIMFYFLLDYRRRFNIFIVLFKISPSFSISIAGCSGRYSACRGCCGCRRSCCCR